MSVLQGLVSNNGRLYAMWKDVPGDERILYSIWNGTGPWSPPQLMAGTTSSGPSLTVYNGSVYAAWKGEWGDPRLFYSSIGAHPIWSPIKIIPNGFSNFGPGLGVIGGALVAVWMNPSDDSLKYSLFNGRLWSPTGTIPGVGSSVGPSLALYNNRLYAAWKGAGTDQGIYYSSFDGLTWSHQAKILNVSTSIGPSLAGVGNQLYAVWKGENTDQALYWSSFDGSNWAPQANIPGGNSSEGAAISVYNGVLYAMWKGWAGDNTLWMSHLNGTTWAPVSQPLVGFTGQDTGIPAPIAPPPSTGLGSYSNYFLADSCRKILGLKVEIHIDQDLVAADPTGANQNTTQGFSFQLNCNSPMDFSNPSNQNWVAWQQYTVEIGGTNVGPSINNWSLAAIAAGSQNINEPENLHIATLARPNVIPAGSTITIELIDDVLGNVTGVTFNLQPGGKPLTVPLSDCILTGGGPITSANTAPIAAFELDIVGPGDGMHAHFTSGAGTVVYSSSNYISPLQSLPACVASPQTTGETANTVYGQLSVSPSNRSVQTFSVSPANW